ncbi:HNH endonuclease signature motif containing protein [Streptomyces albiflavescens]|uniref:HNH endonuclease signature motif containing protein n=1 Tax=Streptomyces albiflavescens TaxID=1623582 RepID=UPI001E54531C|nr:HNH endonuclease signature motif containing protein [Streptomyces albiflavescens]
MTTVESEYEPAVLEAGCAEAPAASPRQVAGPLDTWAALLRDRSPSAETAAALDALDCEQLSPRGRIDALAVLERHMSWLQAKQVELLAAIAAHTDTPELSAEEPSSGEEFDERMLATWDCAAEEVACALRLANATAGQRLATATLLHTRHRATLGLLAGGQISYPQARALADQCRVLSDEAAGQVESVMVAKMPSQSAGQTMAAVRHHIHRVDPEGAEQRHAQRVRERRTLSYPQEDGMALFGAILPAQQTAMMEQAVDTHAATYVDDGRTLDQKRADALYDLVVNQPRPAAASGTAGSPAGRGAAVVQVTVPFDILLGADEGPADLKGYGPITATQAREIAFAPGTIWRRLLTRPETGLLIKSDPTTYRPTADTARQVMARDRYCAFPSCRMPAHRCDLDHISPFNHTHPKHGGQTTPDNLQPLCRRHHRLKTHHPGWKVTRDPHTGTTTWTAPTGHTYTNTPPVYRE